MSTIAVMAGGRSSRMGEDKLMLTLGGETLLDRAVREYSSRFDTVLLSVADAGKYDTAAEPVEDIYPGCGPLGGLHAVLLRTEDEGVFIAAADMPFATAEAAEKLIALCGDAEACVPLDADGRPEPLFAYYKKCLAGRAEENLRQGRRAMRSLLAQARVRTVPAAELGVPRLLENLNTPEEYRRAVR